MHTPPFDLDSWLSLTRHAPLLALYAETHFRFFRFFPSFTYRRRPEVLFDMPRRLAPGHDLPVFLIVNDVDRFPVTVRQVDIAVNAPGVPPRRFEFHDPLTCEIDHALRMQSGAFRFTIPRAALPATEVYVNATVTIERGGTAVVFNDNLVGSSGRPFTCRIADSLLPGQEHCCYGDLHVHSQFSQSHVEFGPPIAAIHEAAGAYGVDFVGITDHSYDLACRADDYLTEDPGAGRWQLAMREFERLKGTPPVMLVGEEISCLNRRGRVGHLCGLGLTEFIPGSADGARRGRYFRKMFRIGEVIEEIHRQGGVAAAAHPGARFGLLQRLLLGRGAWRAEDMAEPLDAVQAANSGFAEQWYRSRHLWVNQLLGGRRAALVAGNDSHGDFNRFRSLKIPFVKIAENFTHHFCRVLTGVYGRPAGAAALLDRIRKGMTFVTDGPFAALASSPSPADSVVSNADLSPGERILYAVVNSTRECGPILRLRVYRGRAGGSEGVLFSKEFGEKETYEVSEPIDNGLIEGGCYLRLEAVTLDPSGLPRQAFTSPCYLGE